MGLLSFFPENSTKPKKHRRQDPDQQPSKRRTKHKTKQKQRRPSSWNQFKNLMNCKQIQSSTNSIISISNSKTYNLNAPIPTLVSSCASICTFTDVVHANARVAHRPDNFPETPASVRSHRPLSPSSSRAMQLRKLSGCYECRTILDPTRYPSSRSTISACPQCREMFPKIESLELHLAVRHAVSELGPEDSGRKIVEIIFKSSWLKKDNTICKIERILKVHNSPKTIQRFEDCRDDVKARALNSARKNPRCAADGNELLRFHCTTSSCSLGAHRSSSLCASVPGCGVCTIIRHGFRGKYSLLADPNGVRTTASSGRAHDSLKCPEGRRAMMVCRVIAGRVRRVAEEPEEEACVYESAVSLLAGVYSNLEELIVFNRRAVLPCFVVIYKAIQS